MVECSGCKREMATWPSGKAEACKAFTPGSNPGVASIGTQQLRGTVSASGLFCFWGREPKREPNVRKTSAKPANNGPPHNRRITCPEPQGEEGCGACPSPPRAPRLRPIARGGAPSACRPACEIAPSPRVPAALSARFHDF